jgi:DNA-binding NtrC family response regulator
VNTSPRSPAESTKAHYGAGREALVASLLVGDSAVMRRLRALIVRVAPTRLPVLIEGPTGAGKELVAQALHALSGRSGQLTAFNVCAIGDALFEDALFGHVRGAFTGAVGEARGYLAEADGGTLFLDEIGGLALGPQAKLLRALETGRFRPVGSAKDRSSDFRIVAATNVSTRSLAASGAFREDLMHRLSGVVLEVPALRDRLEDVPLLARHFAELLPLGAEEPVTFEPSALDALTSLDWSGNVRELRLTVERAAALAASPRLTRADVLAATGTNASGRQRSERAAFFERRLLEVLEQVAWDVDAAAAALGVHRATVYRRLGRIRPRDGGDLRATGGRNPSRDTTNNSRDGSRQPDKYVS